MARLDINCSRPPTATPHLTPLPHPTPPLTAPRLHQAQHPTNPPCTPSSRHPFTRRRPSTTTALCLPPGLSTCCTLRLSSPYRTSIRHSPIRPCISHLVLHKIICLRILQLHIHTHKPCHPTCLLGRQPCHRRRPPSLSHRLSGRNSPQPGLRE